MFPFIYICLGDVWWRTKTQATCFLFIRDLLSGIWIQRFSVWGTLHHPLAWVLQQRASHFPAPLLHHLRRWRLQDGSRFQKARGFCFARGSWMLHSLSVPAEYELLISPGSCKLRPRHSLKNEALPLLKHWAPWLGFQWIPQDEPKWCCICQNIN